MFRQRKELAKIEVERREQLKQKSEVIKKKKEASLLYTMEEVIFEEIEEEEKEGEIKTDDEIEEDIVQYDEQKETSIECEPHRKMIDDEEIPEAIEVEDSFNAKSEGR